MAQKYSRQRETIMNALCARCDHPTAEDIYLAVKEELPRISLGTVYRNLSQLSDEGVILRIRGCGGPDRFDGCTHDHYHFVCQDCSKVIDVTMKPHSELDSEAEQQLSGSGSVGGHSVLFYGYCSDCAKNSGGVRH